MIKSRGWGVQSHWHFVDNPFEDGYTGQDEYNMYNDTWALDEMIYSLKYAKPESGTLPPSTVSYALADSFNLRLLIHYVGDIH